MTDRASAPMRARLLSMITRAVVKRVSEAAGIQSIQVVIRKGETRDAVERAQQYGFTSSPTAGTEVLILAVGSSVDHAISVDVDTDDRPAGLLPGESEQYGSAGSAIYIDSQGVVHLAGRDANDPVARKSDLQALADAFNAHAHSFTASVSGGGGGTVSGTTGDGPSHTATGSDKVMAT